MRQLTLILLLAIATLRAAAANYPTNSDYLWVTTPDHADWLYAPDEEARVEVQLYKYGIAREALVSYAIATDCLAPDLRGTAQLVDGRATIAIPAPGRPCFRDLQLEATVDGATYRHHIKLGFGVEKLRPWTQTPADFIDFWTKAKAEAARFPLTFTREPAPEYSTADVEAWLVKLQLDRRGRAFYGYLLMPRGAEAGSCPVVLTPPGAGVKTIKRVAEGRDYAERGLIRLMIDIHGLDPRMPESYFEQMRSAFETRTSGYLRIGLDSPERYYMRQVYLGLVRALDLLCSLPEWDGRNVIVQGGSQGGALALVAAALDPRVTLCVANHPALADMGAGSVDGLTGGYPHFSHANGDFTPDKLRTMAYHDVTIFAPHITAETFLTWGYNDNTCPPTTSYAVWNALKCPKTSLITPINEHWTSDATDRKQLEWILGKVKK